MAKNQHWYYKLGEEEFGPISSEKLQQIANTGILGPDNLVRQIGRTDWVPAIQIKGLLGNSVSAEQVKNLQKLGKKKQSLHSTDKENIALLDRLDNELIAQFGDAWSKGPIQPYVAVFQAMLWPSWRAEITKTKREIYQAFGHQNQKLDTKNFLRSLPMIYGYCLAGISPITMLVIASNDNLGFVSAIPFLFFPLVVFAAMASNANVALQLKVAISGVTFHSDSRRITGGYEYIHQRVKATENERREAVERAASSEFFSRLMLTAVVLWTAALPGCLILGLIAGKAAVV